MSLPAAILSLKRLHCAIAEGSIGTKQQLVDLGQIIADLEKGAGKECIARRDTNTGCEGETDPAGEFIIPSSIIFDCEGLCRDSSLDEYAKFAQWVFAHTRCSPQRMRIGQRYALASLRVPADLKVVSLPKDNQFNGYTVTLHPVTLSSFAMFRGIATVNIDL